MASQRGTRQRDEVVVPVIEEELKVGKREISSGKVRIHTVVDAVEDVAKATLEEEHVEVTRIPIGKEVESLPSTRNEGDVLVIPVVEEILVVEKRLILKEEIRISRHKTQENVEVPITLRKERAVVERTPSQTSSSKDTNK
jgi:uncharacterized protein (TIGR02271 family)